MRMLSTRVMWGAMLTLLAATASAMWSVHVSETIRALVSLAMMIALSGLAIDLLSSWARVRTLLTVLVGSGVLASLLTLKQYYVDHVTTSG